MGLLELEVEGLGCDQGDQGDRELMEWREISYENRYFTYLLRK